MMVDVPEHILTWCDFSMFSSISGDFWLIVKRHSGARKSFLPTEALSLHVFGMERL